MVAPPLVVTITASPREHRRHPGLGGDGAGPGHLRDRLPAAPGQRPGAPGCPACPHPPSAVQAAAIASTWPSMTSRDLIEAPGEAAAVHRSPPSVVSHRPSPNTKPTDGLANRIPHTAGLVVSNGAASGTTGAGSPRQLAPRFRVRRIDVQGAFAHGAVPRTNASWVETNVTDLAANPIGTGPPDGTVTVDVAADVVGAAAPVEAAPPADAGGELAPPDRPARWPTRSASRPGRRPPPSPSPRRRSARPRPAGRRTRARPETRATICS